MMWFWMLVPIVVICPFSFRNWWVRKVWFMPLNPTNSILTRIDTNRKLNPDLPDNIKIEELLLWNENKLVDFYEAGNGGFFGSLDSGCR